MTNSVLYYHWGVDDVLLIIMEDQKSQILKDQNKTLWVSLATIDFTALYNILEALDKIDAKEFSHYIQSTYEHLFHATAYHAHAKFNPTDDDLNLSNNTAWAELHACVYAQQGQLPGPVNQQTLVIQEHVYVS